MSAAKPIMPARQSSKLRSATLKMKATEVGGKLARRKKLQGCNTQDSTPPKDLSKSGFRYYMTRDHIRYIGWFGRCIRDLNGVPTQFTGGIFDQRAGLS
jgi:hypothetical protein